MIRIFILTGFTLALLSFFYSNDSFARSGSCKYSRKQYLRICQSTPGGPAWPSSGQLEGGKSFSFAPGKDRRVDPRLKHILSGVLSAAKRKNVTITSAYRPCNYNYSVCGAVKSQHLKGKSLDYSISGYTSGGLQKIALSLPRSYGVGGAGKYCGAASHVDTGNRRQWDWCGGGEKKSYQRKKKRRN